MAVYFVETGRKEPIIRANGTITAIKRGKKPKKALTIGGGCGNLTKLSARQPCESRKAVNEKSRKDRKKQLTRWLTYDKIMTVPRLWDVYLVN